MCFREGIGFGDSDPPSSVHTSSLFVFPLMFGRENVRSQPPTESRRRPMNHVSGRDPAEHRTKGWGGVTLCLWGAPLEGETSWCQSGVGRWGGEREYCRGAPSGHHREVIQKPQRVLSSMRPLHGDIVTSAGMGKTHQCLSGVATTSGSLHEVQWFAVCQPLNNIKSPTKKVPPTVILF